MRAFLGIAVVSMVLLAPVLLFNESQALVAFGAAMYALAFLSRRHSLRTADAVGTTWRRLRRSPEPAFQQ